MMGDARLELVRELERMDEAVATALGELDELAAEVEDVRRKARRLQELEQTLPVEVAAADERREQADRHLVEAEQALTRAEAALESAVEGNDRDREREERRNAVRLRDHLHVARRKAQEARATAAELEEQARTVVEERERLEWRARELVSTLRERPRLAKEAGEQVGPGLSGIAEWATNARAALLVARTQLAGERDAVIRQANELAAVVVGEPIAGGTAVVARRVESALGAHD